MISLDTSGRFILQRQVIEALGITNRDVCFIGVDDRIEVWSKSQMEQHFLDADAYGQSLAELMTSTPNQISQ
uniref:MraZ C-terminal domain-containing protein n=1 Tax=Alloprevotella sp. TaxID=1872471 RepID=UPI0040277039